MEKSSFQLISIRLTEIPLGIGGILSNVFGDLITHIFELCLGPKHILQFLVGQF